MVYVSFCREKDPVVDEALHDNILIMTSVGLDLSDKTPFDKLDINAGWVSGFDRARADMTGGLSNRAFFRKQELSTDFLVSSILFTVAVARCITMMIMLMNFIGVIPFTEPEHTTGLIFL